MEVFLDIPKNMEYTFITNSKEYGIDCQKRRYSTMAKSGKKWKTVKKTSSGVQVVNTDTGVVRNLFNMKGKTNKICRELKNNVRYSNDGNIKQQGLTNTQAAWRSGWMAAQQESQKAFKAKNPNYIRKTK